jgi:hypothetical protein
LTVNSFKLKQGLQEYRGFYFFASVSLIDQCLIDFARFGATRAWQGKLATGFECRCFARTVVHAHGGFAWF